MKCCTFYCLYPEIIEGGILDAQSYKLEVGYFILFFLFCHRSNSSSVIISENASYEFNTPFFFLYEISDSYSDTNDSKENSNNYQHCKKSLSNTTDNTLYNTSR